LKHNVPLVRFQLVPQPVNAHVGSSEMENRISGPK
jgi:hypothetical protein